MLVAAQKMCAVEAHKKERTFATAAPAEEKKDGSEFVWAFYCASTVKVFEAFTVK